MSKGPETREAILAIARGEASLNGLQGLSIGGLAKSAGLSKSGLFAHFSSKENLQIAVLESAAALFVDDVVAPALRAPRGLPRMRALFERWIHWSSRELPGGCIFLATASELDDKPGPVRDALVRSQRDWLGALAQSVRIAIEEGHLDAETDPEDFACRWMSLLVGHGYFARLLHDPRSEERTREGFESLVHAHRPAVERTEAGS